MSIPRKNTTLKLTALAAAVLALSACGGSSDPVESTNIKPSYLGAIATASYDGNSDDLLTAGLGKAGLGAATSAALTPADPLKPTAAELRKLAIFNNYRAILDISAAGGYGTLYGPNVDAKGVITTSEGKIAGTEYIAYSDDGTGKQNITMLVQVPRETLHNSHDCVLDVSPA